MMNTTALAFIGDAVYEVYIRKHVMDSIGANANKLHRAAVGYVCAGSQAKAVKRLMAEFLTEEETALVKRARNHKISTKSRSADAVTYKLATAFEALIGFLFLAEEQQRLEQVIFRAIEIIEEKDHE